MIDRVGCCAQNGDNLMAIAVGEMGVQMDRKENEGVAQSAAQCDREKAISKLQVSLDGVAHARFPTDGCGASG